MSDRLAPRMLLRKLVRGVAWRLAFDSELEVFRAGPADQPAALPPGVEYLGVAAAEAPGAALARAANPAAGEPEVLDARLAHGDEFFGLVAEGKVVCFGWGTVRDRLIGASPGRELPGRWFLFNFHTLEEWRGRGLYTALLRQIRHEKGRAGAVEFIIEADRRNQPSLRGIVRAGFEPLARASYRTILRRWQWPLERSMADASRNEATLWAK